MKHPSLCPWVELSVEGDILRIQDSKQDQCFHTPAKYAPFLRGLDGRTPPHLAAPELTEKERSALLRELKHKHLTRQNAAFSKSLLSLYFTIPLSCPTEGWRMFAHVFNNTLLKMWLPSLVLAAWGWITCPIVLLDNHIWLGSILGLILGMLLHELAHTCACITYGGRVHGCGVMLWCLMPGAFVELDTDSVKHPLQKAQIFAAGVEMNLYLAAFFLLLSASHPMLGTPALCAATTNGMLALMNLTLTSGLDGMHILSSLLGIDDLCAMAMNILFDETNRRVLTRQGFQGKAALSFCWVGLVMQLFFPLVLAVNISEVLLWLL